VSHRTFERALDRVVANAQSLDRAHFHQRVNLSRALHFKGKLTLDP
jgi:hypothetical protein